MSAFSPDVPPIPQTEPADLLARFVPSALRRTPPVMKVWRLPRLVFLAFVTAGFLPCRALQVRLGQTMMMHAQQCDLVAEFLKKHLAADDSEAVTDAARGVNVSFAWLNASAVIMMVALGLMVFWLWGHDFSIDACREWWLATPLPEDWIAWLSTGLLSAAYLLLIVQSNRQLLAMQQLALAINAVEEGRIEPIEPPPLVWGLRVFPLAIGIAGAAFGLIWALPMMLAWSAFASFGKDAAYEFRVQLADRLTKLSCVEPVVPTIDLCPNPQCRQSLPIDAVFCPRCGQPLGPRMTLSIPGR